MFKQWLNEKLMINPTMEPDLRTALNMAFGKNTPYMIDPIYLNALETILKTRKGNLKDLLDQISNSKGFGTRIAVQNFITAPGSNLDKIKAVTMHRANAAKDFANGLGQ